MSDTLAPLQWEQDLTIPAAMDDGMPASSRSFGTSSAARPFAWPSPPYVAYPAVISLRGAEPCEIEGFNGRMSQGRLARVSPGESVIDVQLPPSRGSLPLRFDQFRTLRLTTPVDPYDIETSGAAQRGLVAQRPRSEYHLVFSDGKEWDGETIGHVLEEFGLFLFHPIGDTDSVHCVFVPRSSLRSFEIGSKLGELLIEAQAATPAQIELAVETQRELRDQRIGDILRSRQVVNAEALHAAIEQQSRMPMVRIGEALLSLGLIDDRQLDGALSQQRVDRGVPLGEILVRNGTISRPDLQSALARKMGYPVVDVSQFPCDPAAIKRLNFPTARRLGALPLMVREGRLVVALEDPAQPQVIDELEFAAQMKVVPVLAPWGTLEAAMRAAFDRVGSTLASQAGGGVIATETFEFEPPDTSQLVASLEREGAESRLADEDKAIEQSDNSLVRLINNMIVEASTEGVSDIHIECYPGREKVKIRFRKDGTLQPYLELPHNYKSALIARIKIMCDLDISERRKPQDGKINFAKFSPQHKLELRVATIPTNNGMEDIVMRLLASAKPLPLVKLGLSPNNQRWLEEATERPYGLVLCVGPTGSGKTTTLHSALAHINRPDRKIWTAEDPVEITQAGLRQVQVNPKIDWTFAKALRAFLRADPDVIMVGEIRDQETAHMAVEASLTGHLVMSTLHTNSAPETVTRLLDMGLDPFNFADSLLAVLAQRLVKRLCGECRSAEPASSDRVDELLADYLHGMPADTPALSPDTVLAGWRERFGRDGRLLRWHAPGCKACGKTGQKGRAGLHELMSSSRELRRLVQTGARAEELQAQALAAGMRTLRQDGIDKVWQGVTSIDEVRATSNA